MLYWAAAFLIASLITAALGFTSIAVAIGEAARLAFFIFIILFGVALAQSALSGDRF